MNYSDMTDFFINKAVAATFLEEWYDNGKCVIKCDDDDRSIFNPCNSWSDAGPIIVSNLIALKPVSLFVGGHRWFATKGEGDFGIKAADNNPLRAAMIVFLKMQESK